MEININCDLGESSKLHSTENDPLLLEIVNSASIACGYHAGDEQTMGRTIEFSKKNNVSIGAHPSFNDPENFGRKRLNLPESEIKKLIISSIPDASIEIKDLIGDKNHYSALIKSKMFKGLSKIDQHKLVYRSLNGKMGNELHAFSFKTEEK